MLHESCIVKFHSHFVHILVLTKTEQLCGNVWKFLETVEEAVCHQGAFLSSLLFPFCCSPSLDEDWRDWEGGAGGVDTQRNLPSQLLGMKTRRGLTDLARGEGERENVRHCDSPVGNEVAWASWIRLGGFNRDKREALVDLLDGTAPPSSLPILILLLANPLHQRLKLGELGGGAHGRGGW